MSEVESCVEAMKRRGMAINLDSLLFGVIQDGMVGGSWTYFDELAHRMAGKSQGDELSDDEIMMTIEKFKQFGEVPHEEN